MSEQLFVLWRLTAAGIWVPVRWPDDGMQSYARSAPLAFQRMCELKQRWPHSTYEIHEKDWLP